VANIEVEQVKTFPTSTDMLKLSFYLGRKSLYKDKFINIFIKEKEAEKFIEDLMRVISEKKIEKFKASKNFKSKERKW